MDSDDTQSVSEMLPDNSGNLPEQQLLDASNAPIVNSLLCRLEPRERNILELRFGLDGYEGPPRTFKEIGQIIGLTRERVRQLEKKALGELKVLAEQIL